MKESWFRGGQAPHNRSRSDVTGAGAGDGLFERVRKDHIADEQSERDRQEEKTAGLPSENQRPESTGKHEGLPDIQGRDQRHEVIEEGRSPRPVDQVKESRVKGCHGLGREGLKLAEAWRQGEDERVIVSSEWRAAALCLGAVTCRRLEREVRP